MAALSTTAGGPVETGAPSSGLSLAEVMAIARARRFAGKIGSVGREAERDGARRNGRA